MNVTKLAVATLAALALSACANMQAQQQAQQLAQERAQHDALHIQAIAACDAKLPKKVGNMVARANCMTDADQAYLIPVYPNSTELIVFEAYRLVTATKMDRGEISIEEGILMNVEKMAQLKAEIENRRIAAQNAAAAERANNAVTAAAILGVMNANQPLNVNVYHH
jgi:hypothetical protein